MTTKLKFNCIFCKDVFENKEELQDHFRKHGDPKYKNRFATEAQDSNEKSKEKAEMVSCDVCSQVFPTISKAITHKHKVHPDHDAKYFCPWCGKLFTMKHLYNVHVQSNHSNQDQTDDKSFKCESCNVDFFVPSAMIYHNKFFHRQDTDLPDIGQSKKIKLYNQEVISIYYCAFCGEEYENKVNLFKHMTDDHGDENQSPDEVLKCPLCEAVFYHLDAYEIHLTFHTSEDMYSIQNEEYSNLLDYSLETVPPIIEKVENLETESHTQDTDAESTINAVGIEKFLELAMDQSEDSNSVKVKKHKKHKKSKKSAITLDEFLSMNQDVFGEGLDFQGIEEVPTRVVKKQLKNNKKPTNSSTSVEIEKLKKAGIVIKKKVGRRPISKGLKVAQSAHNSSFNKINPEQEIRTSSEVLTKLINQSNNQIKIVKKSNFDNATNEPQLSTIAKEVPIEKTETSVYNTSENIKQSNYNIDLAKSSPATKPDDLHSENITKELCFPKSNESLVTATKEKLLSNKLNESDTNTDVVKKITKETSNNNTNMQEMSKCSDFDRSLNLKSNENNNRFSEENDEEININELDPNRSDAKLYQLDTKNAKGNNININEIPETDNNNCTQHSTNSPAVSSLSTLKHLSHLITVKPVSQTKNTIPSESTNLKVSEAKDDQNIHKAKIKETPHLLSSIDKPSPSKTNIQVDKDPTLDALKNLSKNITIKSLSTKRNIGEGVSEDDGDFVEDEINRSDLNLKDVSANKNITIKKIKVETSECKPDNITNSLNSKEKQAQPTNPLSNKSAIGVTPTKIKIENTDSTTQSSNANILKRLTNITTKPVINKNINLPVIKQSNTSIKNLKTEEVKEEIIEIFDIDDSDDEDEMNSKQPEASENVSKSMDALKNLSKNITVKSLNQPVQKNVKIETNIKQEKEQEGSPRKYKDVHNVDNLINMQNRNMVYKNVLQGLSKNITIKSRNSSPSQSVKSQDYNTQDSKVMEDNEASDSNSSFGNIKITEIDDDMLDNEINAESFEHLNTSHDPIVESPNDSSSDNEEIDEIKAHDFENDIKVSTVQKCNESMNTTTNSMCLNSLKNISKNITIKSFSKNSIEKEDKNIPVQMHECLETPHNQKKQWPLKLSKHLIREPECENTTIGRTLKNTGPSIDHTSTQSVNQKMSAMNQVNTINKEVTVKTFQTKTVIQEITTTVTKTIKTVNQTVNQEVRNTCQTNVPVATQKVQGMRTNPSKNLQGVVIRHAAPSIGAKIGNAATRVRPASTAVRPSTQIVPMRAGINVIRPNNPNMAIGKKVASSSPPNKPVIGKPLKMAATAMVSTISKRPNIEDVSGPFSCFKKPKESLIPVSDIPSFANSGSEAAAQLTTASLSSSNITSTTRTVKGNSVVTAKQFKSEVSATSQQLNRFNNTTGLKVMTTHAKQSHVQEKSEANAMKRTTLEAIQKLQKQGLLVKKPRIDSNECGGDSDHNSDNNVEYSSADEPNE